jgi:hypothetical protein
MILGNKVAASVITVVGITTGVLALDPEAVIQAFNKITIAAEKFEVKTAFKNAEKCFSYQQSTRGYYAAIQFPNCFHSPDAGGDSGTGLIHNKKISSIDKVLKQDLENLREKVGTDIDTIAVGRTDIEGLEDVVFEGASPEVMKVAPKEAGLKPLDPNRKIKAPFDSPRFTRHAEEMVINQFVDAVDAKFPNPLDVKGKLYIHQSNPRGVCPACKSGLGKSKADGVLLQLSKRYPNLEIIVSSETQEGKKVTMSHFFVLKNGKQYKYVEK